MVLFLFFHLLTFQIWKTIRPEAPPPKCEEHRRFKSRAFCLPDLVPPLRRLHCACASSLSSGVGQDLVPCNFQVSYKLRPETGAGGRTLCDPHG